jgi:energy-coupling factor transporter ATP-binding protein EcfA2
MKLIELRDIWVKYRGAKDYSLKGIHFELEEGEIVGVIGPTGAGKTTLAKVMSGVVPNMGAYDDFRGRALVGGKDTSGLRVGEISRLCSMVHQDYEIQLFRTTVELEVAFGPENLCLPRDEIADRVARSLELSGLRGLEKRYTFGLSGGQKQRVAIAAMLALRPQVLVLDEATSDLDPLGKREIYDVIRNLLEGGVLRGLVLIDHRLEKMAEFVQRVVVMKDGQIIRSGDAREVLTDVPFLQQLGLKPPEVAEVYHRLGIASAPKPLLVREAMEWFPRSRVSAHPPDDQPAGHIPALSLSDVWFAYEGRNWVVQIDSMQLCEGEMVGLVGQNGSGKTTVAQLMMGILRPQRGRITLFGEDVTMKGF